MFHNLVALLDISTSDSWFTYLTQPKSIGGSYNILIVQFMMILFIPIVNNTG